METATEWAIPYAQANLATIPAERSDEQVVLLADIASTGAYELFGERKDGVIEVAIRL